MTGASSRHSGAAASALAVAGAAVTVNHHDEPDAAQEVLNSIRSAGGEGIGVDADVSDEGAVTRLVEATSRAFTRIGIVVVNAGMRKDASITATTPDPWQRPTAAHRGILVTA